MADIDLQPFWADHDQIVGEFNHRLELQQAGDFWSGYADQLTKTRDELSRAGDGLRNDGKFGGLAATRFYDRLAASTKSIDDGLALDAASLALQFGGLYHQVSTAFNQTVADNKTLYDFGIADHQPVLPRPWYATGNTNDVIGAMELTRGQREALQAAYQDLTLRLGSITAPTWGGFGSQSGGPISGDAYNQGVALFPDVVDKYANDLTLLGRRPSLPGGTVIHAYPLMGPLSQVADPASVTTSGAAVTFRDHMTDGVSLAGDTLQKVSGLFRHQDHRGYLEILQALG